MKTQLRTKSFLVPAFAVLLVVGVITVIGSGGGDGDGGYNL